MLPYIILGTLYNKPLTGYEIKKMIAAGVGLFYKASYGSIYPILADLMKNNMISCEAVEGSGRNQKRYTITDSGKGSFLSWLKSCDLDDSKAEAFVAKVFFFDKLDMPDAQIQIDAFHQKLELSLQDLCKQREEFIHLPNQNCFYYKLSTLYFGIVKLQGLLDWCEVIRNRRKLEDLVIRNY